MTNKTFLNVNKICVCIITSKRRRNIFAFLKLEGQRGARTSDLQLSNAPGPALYMDRVLHMLPIYSVIESQSITNRINVTKNT